jgi:HEAT repeat protein
VIAGLADPHWRVREMCAKVCRLREIAEAAPALVRLAGDPVERVRLAALKAIGDICEADSAAPLLALAGERGREADVAAAALRRMEERLDRQDLGDV